ncbi:MAG: hypothetical protein ABIO70_36415 [Pseudomonadota bacterium]
MIRSLACLFFALASGASAQEGPEPLPLEALPIAAEGLLAVAPFTLQEARPYAWMRDHPAVREGLLIALEVSPALARPRQTAEPVLYVGGVPAERLNAGYPTGHLLVMIPGKPDLSAEPVYFGHPGLPERLDADDGLRALAEARAAGIVAFSAEQVRAAQAAGGSALALRDARALDLAIASWIEAWAPEEAHRAEGLRAPSP